MKLNKVKLKACKLGVSGSRYTVYDIMNNFIHLSTTLKTPVYVFLASLLRLEKEIQKKGYLSEQLLDLRLSMHHWSFEYYSNKSLSNMLISIYLISFYLVGKIAIYADSFQSYCRN